MYAEDWKIFLTQKDRVKNTFSYVNLYFIYIILPLKPIILRFYIVLIYVKFCLFWKKQFYFIYTYWYDCEWKYQLHENFCLNWVGNSTKKS